MRTESNLLLAVIFLGILCVSAESAITADDLISQLEQRERDIKSIRGKFTVRAEIMMNDGNTVELEKQYEWLKKGHLQKVTVEIKSIPEKLKGMMPHKEIRTFDGQVTKRFLPDSNDIGVYHGGDFFFLGKVPPDWLLSRLQQKSFSTFLREKRQTIYEGKADSNGQQVDSIKLTSPTTNGKLYLAEEHGQLVAVRYEDCWTDQNLAFDIRAESVFDNFKLYGNICLPTKVAVDVCHVYPDKEKVVNREIFTVEDLEVNVEIPDSDLAMNFPPGTHVNDLVAGKSYVVDANSK